MESSGVTLLWGTVAGHSCKTLLRKTLVGPSCRTLLWDTLVESSWGGGGQSCGALWRLLCGTVLWDALARHSTLMSCGTRLLDTLVGDSCRTFWLETLVGHSLLWFTLVRPREGGAAMAWRGCAGIDLSTNTSGRGVAAWVAFPPTVTRMVTNLMMNFICYLL